MSRSKCQRSNTINACYSLPVGSVRPNSLLAKIGRLEDAARPPRLASGTRPLTAK